MWDLIKKVVNLHHPIRFEYIIYDLKYEVELVTTIHEDLDYDRVFGRRDLGDFTQVSCTVNNFYFLKQQKDIKCSYCLRELVIYNFNNFNRENGATVDHMKPKSKGGSLYSFDNLCISCSDCNTRKSNMEFIEWLKILINENKPK